MVTGWGDIKYRGDAADILQEVTLMTVRKGVCRRVIGGGVTSSMFCAGNIGENGDILGGKDSCQGDSGGPLIYNRIGNQELAGIVSFGFKCAKKGMLGVYADVWSKTFMNKGEYLSNTCVKH